MSKLRFIDLFAGLGGLRLGLEAAAKLEGIESECVFTSEIKPHAIKAYQANFPGDIVSGDITKIDALEIQDFDVLLAGFPCQPFSSAGKGQGFMDTRGTLFFDIERILKAKKPKAFILENVEGLVGHDKVEKGNPIGRTLETILKSLESLGYQVSWKVFDASKHGLPQKRKRIYIVGTLENKISLENFVGSEKVLDDVLEAKWDSSLEIKTPLVTKLLKQFDMEYLLGKQIRDKRGGPNNIHSWDIELKGAVNQTQKELLSEILLVRRRKSLAEGKGIPWSDGMPLTLNEILQHASSNLSQTYSRQTLETQLDDLVAKGYLSFESPKKAPESPAGYNISTGKLSFDISHILDVSEQTPTLVATDVTRLAVPAGKSGLRRLSVREGLRLFGFPETYQIPEDVSYAKAFDLLGNSVTLNVVEMVATRIVKAIK